MLDFSTLKATSADGWFDDCMDVGSGNRETYSRWMGVTEAIGRGGETRDGWQHEAETNRPTAGLNHFCPQTWMPAQRAPCFFSLTLRSAQSTSIHFPPLSKALLGDNAAQDVFNFTARHWKNRTSACNTIITGATKRTALDVPDVQTHGNQSC